MHALTSIATAIGALARLATAVINLAAIYEIRTEPRPDEPSDTNCPSPNVGDSAGTGGRRTLAPSERGRVWSTTKIQ